MKITILATAFFLAATTFTQAYAQRSQGNIQLPEVDQEVEMTLFEALQQRTSSREFSSEDISLQMLSQILWAADGINRPENGKLTAPSALNRQSIDIYVCRKDGSYLWHKDSNQLELITTSDLREAIRNGQEGTDVFPLALLLVTDNSKFAQLSSESPNPMGIMDAAYISQNINLVCTALHLNNVPRVNMNQKELRKELKLTKTQFPILNNIIGKKK